MRVALVHNPSSGDAEADGEELADLLRASGHHVDYYASKRDWGSVLSRAPDLVAVAGGDGTVRRIAPLVADSHVPLAVLPMGTANNIARALGIADVSPAELVAGWPRGRLLDFDVGSASGPWGADLFLESVGVGLLSDTIAEIDHGPSGYVNELDRAEARVAAALDVFERVACAATPFHCRIRLDDRRLEGEYLLVEVLNFGAAGPNLRLSPRADPADGIFDVVLVDDEHQKQLGALLAAVREGVTPLPALPIHHAREVELTCASATLHLDDRVFHARDTGGVWFNAVLRPAALRFLVP